MNNEVRESYVMNSEVSTSGVCSDEVSSLSHVWFCDVRCLADSVLASFPKTRHTFTVSHCVFWFWFWFLVYF